jgi:1-hydroxycarotenoid 3,4-desaturase
MRRRSVAVIGAGVGGLVAAAELAAQGFDVTLFERAARAGGKLRQIPVGGRGIDSGPTVFTMRWVFDSLFSALGSNLDRALTLRPASCLARHAWNGGARLDLHADRAQTIAAIGAFAGPREAEGYRAFCDRAQDIYETLKDSFIAAERPSPLGLTLRVGPQRLGALLRISPFAKLWGSLGTHFSDPRLRQLFGRYATYCGASPFLAPATLMLVAHVEREGVWLVDGGMQSLADALQQLAEECGATLRFGAHVARIAAIGGRITGVVLASGEHVAADAVVMAGDVNALADGLLGSAVADVVSPVPPERRSLSAVTWSMRGVARGFPLSHHNVFFSDDYAAEFDDIFQHRRLPQRPTVYLCAQDRGEDDAPRSDGAEPLFLLVNAPPTGDSANFSPAEIATCLERAFRQLTDCGLEIEPLESVPTTPRDFAGLFPGSGGALYGRASHGWAASFQRPGARTAMPGLYLAGGSVHPGPGVPMAALSGRLAAARVARDFASTRSSHPMATSGGMSMPSAKTDARR